MYRLCIGCLHSIPVPTIEIDDLAERSAERDTGPDGGIAATGKRIEPAIVRQLVRSV